MSRKLLDERPLIVLPSLAREYGVNGAIFLQQLHWRSRSNAALREGDLTWVKRSLEEWATDFPFWPERTLRRVIERLREAGVIDTKRGRESGAYALRYEKLASESGQNAPAEWPDESGQSDLSPSMKEKNSRGKDSSSFHSEAESDFELQHPKPPEPTPLFEAKTEMDEQIEEVWAYYCERATPVNAELTPARKRMLRSALKEATVEECKLAIDGNRMSSWHRERGKHNLSDIFRPGRDGNLRRQLDRFISDAQAAGAGALPKLSSASMSGLAREMKDMVYSMHSYDTEDARKKGEEAVRWLAEHGVTTIFREGDGWPIFTEEES